MVSSLSGKDITVDYRSRSYEQLRTQMLALASTLIPDLDIYPHDPAVVIMEALALQGDILSAYIDRAVEESHWTTAQTRKSIINQAALLGYNLSPAVSATVTITVTTNGDAGTLYGVTGDNSASQVPFRITTSNLRDQTSFTFELLEEYEFAEDETEADLVFIEGRTIIESLGTSDGSSGLSLTLANKGVTTNPDGTFPIIVIVNDGDGDVIWTKAPSNNFVDSEEDSEHYILSVDEFDQVTIRFGDGVNGAIPANGAVITVRYRVGGGSAANNIGAGRITSIVTTGTIATSVTNDNKPSGGSARETIAEAKVNAPKYFSTQNRAASHSDYEALALTVNGVRRAKATWYQNRPLIEAVYIASSGQNPIPSGTWDLEKQSGTGLLGSVGKVLKEKACASVKLNILPVVVSNVIVTMNVVCLPNFRQSDVKARVRTEVEDFVLPSNTSEIPALLSLSDLYRRIENIRGVDRLKVTSLYRNPYVKELSVGNANTTFSEVEVFDTVQKEKVYITFINADDFEVVGEVTGVHANGTVDEEYTSSNGEFKFTATQNSISNRAGDVYCISFGNYVDDIEFLEEEIGVLETVTINLTGGVA